MNSAKRIECVLEHALFMRAEFSTGASRLRCITLIVIGRHARLILNECMGEIQSKLISEEPQRYLAALEVLFAAGALVPATDVARYLDISMERLVRLGNAGRIRFTRRGYGWRYYSRHDVERFLMIEGYPVQEATTMRAPAEAPATVAHRTLPPGNVVDLAAARARLRG